MYRNSAVNGKNDYAQYRVEQEMPLLEFLFTAVKESKNKIKLTLKGRGVKVNGKVVTQFDYPLVPGMRVAVSRSKRNDTFKSRYVKIVYEDRWLVLASDPFEETDYIRSYDQFIEYIKEH